MYLPGAMSTLTSQMPSPKEVFGPAGGGGGGGEVVAAAVVGTAVVGAHAVGFAEQNGTAEADAGAAAFGVLCGPTPPMT